MSMTDKLNYLLETKKQIKNAITQKGVAITDEDTFRSYANKISSIEAGSSNPEEYFLTTISSNDTAYIMNKLLKKMPFEIMDTSNVTNMSNMFYGCNNLESINVSNFDTSKVTNMSSMFYGCSNLNEIDISNFDTSIVANMSNMFNGCSALEKINLSGLDANKVTNMSSMFVNCSNLTQVNFNNFSSNGVTNMASMFSGCIKLTELNLNNFYTNIVTSTTNMFLNCRELVMITGIIDMSKVTSLNNMFLSTSNLETVSIENLNQTGLNFSTSPKLSHDSMMYLINNLIETTTTKSITFGATNLAKLTDEEKAIATSKGWTLG